MQIFQFKQEQSKTFFARQALALAAEGYQTELIVRPRATEIRSTPGLKLLSSFLYTAQLLAFTSKLFFK